MKTNYTWNRVSITIFLLTSITIFFQCDKESEVMYYKISGIVTYANDIPADGAVVTISSDDSGAVSINRVVASSDGAYLLDGLPGGIYFLTASYNTANQNNLKSDGYNFVTSEPIPVEVSGNINKNITLVNKVGGNEMINTRDGSWYFDKAHSNINWETAYMGENALLTGKFTSFNIDIDFDESNPEATTIAAWVQLSSALTGEPGRDYLGGCLNGYLGVELDTLPGGDHYISDKSTDTAYFKSVSVAIFGDGYKAMGDFTFKKITKSVDLYFHYIGQADYSSGGDGSSIRGGFSGEFEFLAITDFQVTSTSIADKINVKINANYRKR